MSKSNKQNNKTNRSTSSWASSIRDPFHAPAAHIPDFETNSSGVVTSRTYFQHVTSSWSGTSTSHSGGIVVFPNPYGHVVELTEAVAGSGDVSDLNVAGTALFNGHDAPNAAGFGDSCKLRMTSCGVSVTFAGAELQRAGEYVSGNAQLEYPASSTASTGTQLSPLSTILGTQALGKWGSATVRQYIKDYQETRVGDKTQMFYWLPNGVPLYFRTGSNIAYRGTPNTSAGAQVLNSVYASTPSGGGPPFGENALMILISGDVSSAAGSTGNTYDVEVVTHWEIIPANITAVTFDIAPSLSDPMALSAAMNACSRAPSNITPIVALGSSGNTKQNKTIKQRAYEFVLANQEPIFNIGTKAVQVAARATQRKALTRRPAYSNLKRIEL